MKHLIMIVVCLTAAACFQDKEALRQAEDALAAHKQFIDNLEIQTGLTVVNHLNNSLAGDVKFLARDSKELPRELGSAQYYLKNSRESARELVSAFVESAQYQGAAKDALTAKVQSRIGDIKSNIESAEAAIKKYKG